MKKFRFGLIIIILLFASVSFGADIYVNHTGSSTPPYDTEAKAATDIQVALDAANPGDTVLIKADQDYVMNGTDQQAAQFDIDASSYVTIKGYYLSPGDQDYGGTYYKDSSHGWAVIDANNGSYNVFGVDGVSSITWENIKTADVNSSDYPFYASPSTTKDNYIFRNLALTGGKGGIYLNNVYAGAIADCEFIGTFGSGTSDAIVRMVAGAYGSFVVADCLFEVSGTKKCIYIQGSYCGTSIFGNIFNISGTVSTCIHVTKGGLVANNVIYENSGGTITDGIYVSSRATVIYGNIIVGCATSINDIVGVIYGGWNCFYNNSSNWTLHAGDIVADPQFMDATNGNFKLKPTSPCLNTGKPTLGNGYTSIGAWQRKSLLR